MKCEVCIKLLEEYVDGELAAPEAAAMSDHLLACAGCANELDTLTTEQEMYARYDRGLEISPSMWGIIAERTTAPDRVVDSATRFRLRDWFLLPSFGWSFAGAMAVLLVALLIGVAYQRARWQSTAPNPAQAKSPEDAGTTGGQQVVKEKMPAPNPGPTQELARDHSSVKTPSAAGSRQPKKPGTANRSDVLDSEVALLDAEEQDTQRHLEQAENLLRSVRNIQVSVDELEVDVSYEKALSRRLLNENVVLRRDAEMSGKFPTKTLLSDLEPFLIDIANLPDKASPDDLRVIKERVQKTEIVADLRSY